MSQTKLKAILIVSIQRTSSDLLNFLHYVTEPLALLLPANFFEAGFAQKINNPLVTMQSLESKVIDRQEVIDEYQSKVNNLNFNDTPAAEFNTQIKNHLNGRLTIALELIDALEEAKEEYNLIGFITHNEAYQRERIMRDWCKANNIPTLHINHGLILGHPGGAYADFQTQWFTGSAPIEENFLASAFAKANPQPNFVVTGMPSWDKYALVKGKDSLAQLNHRLGLPAEQKLITFFPTIRNTTYINQSKQDPHLAGIESFINIAAELAPQHPEFSFVIKDRPGNDSFMAEIVEIQRKKHGLNEQQLVYAFDFAEPYVAFSTLTLAQRSTISSESILCQVPHINLFSNIEDTYVYSSATGIAQAHVDEAAELINFYLTDNHKLEELKEQQQASQLLIGPAADFCSSMRVALVIAEAFDFPQIIEKINLDLSAWQTYLTKNPNPTNEELFNSSPLSFHWQHVESLLNFDHRFAQEAAYNRWLARKHMQEVDGQLMAERMQNNWAKQPTFHLIYVVDESLFNGLADSLDALDHQIYKNFGISILSTAACPEPSLLELQHLQWLTHEQPFSQLNQIIEQVDSDWVIVLQPGDTLVPDALFNLAEYANLNNDWLALYTDEDEAYKDTKGELRRKNPSFKPSFNYELLLATNYVGHCVALRKDALLALEGLTDLPYVQNEDFLLRLAERMTLPAIGHVPFIANHRGSELNQALATQAVEINGTLVRQAHLQRLNLTTAEVHQGLKPRTWQIKYPINHTPSVALLIPITEWHDAAALVIQSLLDTTTYANYKIYLGLTDTVKTLFNLEELHKNKVEVVPISSTPNRTSLYKELAQAANKADFYCLMESDVHAVQSNWLDQLVMHGQRPQVGMVGPRLVLPNGRVFSAGQILGLDGYVGDWMQNFHLEQDLKDHPRAWCDQNFSALNSSCLLISRANWLKFGLNDNLPTSLYAADLGLRMQLEGLRLHWTPYSTLATQGIFSQAKKNLAIKEEKYFYEHWFNYLSHDPAHNLNLELTGNGTQPEIKLLANWHPIFRQQPRILLLPLHINASSSRLLGSLGYFLTELEKQEQIRVAWCNTHLLAKDHDLPNLVELARLDADLILLVGDEVGTWQGRAAQLKELTGCKLGVYTHAELENSYWAEQAAMFDLHLSTSATANANLFVPNIKESEATPDLASVSAALFSLISSVLKKSKN